MRRPVQRPPLPQEGEGPILTHRPLQMPTKDLPPIGLAQQGMPPPWLGRHGLLPAAGRHLPLLRVHPLIVIVNDRLRQEAIPCRILSHPLLLTQQWQAVLEIIAAPFNLLPGFLFTFGAMDEAHVQAPQDPPELDPSIDLGSGHRPAVALMRHPAQAAVIVDIIGQRPAIALDRLAHHLEMRPTGLARDQ